MRILFVYPRFQKFLESTPELGRELIDFFLGKFTTPPSLGIPILAALTPPHVEIAFADDNSGDVVDFEAAYDLVAINCFTPQATRAFEIADEFRRRGTRVIMGGLFPTFRAEECLAHADSVNIGEAEPTWGRIVEDARAGTLQRTYDGGSRFDITRLPRPRRDLFYSKETYDWDEDLVQVTRGCSYACAMCVLPSHMGNRIRFRPIDQVVDEIRGLRYENVYLADDTLFFPQRKLNEYARELFRALAPLGKKYFVSSTMSLATEPDFFDLAAKAGVANFYCTLNVDPISINALRGSAKDQQALIDLVRSLEDRGMRFFASLALGRDWDDDGTADRALELLARANVNTAEFFVFTPYPGAIQWDRLESQQRIIDRTWAHYNGAHVVFRPANMPPERLYDQFIYIWKEFFRMRGSTHAANFEPATWKNGERSVGKPLERRGVKGQAAITGTGLIGALGSDTATVVEALKSGKHGLRPITRFDTSHFRARYGGEVPDFDPLREMTEEEVRTYEDRYLQFAICAARRALSDAGLHLSPGVVRRDIALVLGTCNGGLLSAEEEYAYKHGKSSRRFDEKMNLQAQLYGFGKALTSALGIAGETWVVATACSSTTAALGLAQTLINRGYHETVLVGGADALCIANLSGFDGLKATSAGLTAPFSLPMGLNVGEGAGFWVVEEMESALLRNAKCLGIVAGHAVTSDAYHPTAPDPRGDGAFRTLRNALNDSGLTITEIGCINAHGTGTEANDRAESKGIARLIGELPIPAVSTKSFFGHCMGATGILEATCNLLAMNAGFIPPTLNFTEPRPGCTLDYVPNIARPTRYRAFLSANYAFGGNNAAVTVCARDVSLAQRHTPPQRVVVTGTGCVTSLGLGTGRLLEALRQNRVGLCGIERLGLSGMRSRLAGLVAEFKAAEIDRRLDFSGLNLVSRYALAAARLALEDAHSKTGPKTAEEIGIAMGVSNGPPETGHMDSVFKSENYAPDLTSFANVVVNSTAGWVSNALCLKGPNISLAPGPHAAVQALAYAYDCLVEDRARIMLAAGSDEVYQQMFFNYDLLEYLYRGAEEEEFRIRAGEQRRTVLGEGAAALVMETLASAQERNAPILAEVLGYGMSTDAAPFTEQCADCAGLVHAVSLCLRRSGIGPGEVGMVAWAPQGNAQDMRVLSALEAVLGERSRAIPMVTTTFNTGFIESASILVSLAAALETAAAKAPTWPQRTGMEQFDGLGGTKADPGCILVVGGGWLGYNYAVALRAGG